MRILFILLISILICDVYAQEIPSSDKKAQKLYQEAGRFLSYQNYDQALEQLKRAVVLDSVFISAWQLMGDINKKLLRYEQAKRSYRKVLSISPDFYRPTYYNLAECEFNTGIYDSARVHFQHYAAYDGITDQTQKKIAKYIADCEFSMYAMQHPLAFHPVNLGPAINTVHKEYFPAITADERSIIFTRQIGENEDFYTSTKDSLEWQKASYLSKNINTNQYNEGSQCISPDGMYLFFSGCNWPEGLGRCDIYVCRREVEGWSEPFNIGTPVNTEGWESQPSLSADGRTLYFVSNRSGGIGGYDIWKSNLNTDGSWSEPENMGTNVNTIYDEQAPFIHPDGQTLYFSSNGWPGLGNKDLFISRKDSAGNWQKPQNMGYPINTYGEETGLVVSSNGKSAYYASNRPDGEGDLDIYTFDLPDIFKPHQVTYVRGLVMDTLSREYLDAVVQMIDLKSGKLIYDDKTNKNDGIFLATMSIGSSFALHVSKEGYLFYSENFALDTIHTQTNPFYIHIPLQKIQTNKIVVLKNIFFKTNSYDLLPQSETELQKLVNFLQTNPKLVIEIGGHTDNVGNEKFNMSLSENRAKAVYNYLIAHHIPSAQLRYKGYGKSKPIADNATETGKAQNRRTEFSVIKVY